MAGGCSTFCNLLPNFRNLMTAKTQHTHHYILAIDLGSTSLKTAMVADNGEVIASAEDRITTHMLPGGGAEQDPEEWWEVAKQTSRKVIDRRILWPLAAIPSGRWSFPWMNMPNR